MTENWKIQVSPKLADGTLINLRAENPQEAESILAWATNNAKLITDTVAAFVGTSNVTSVLPTAGVQTEGQPWSAPQAAPPAFVPQQQAAPPQQGKVCQHGPMVARNGTSAKGPWSGWFCPTPKGTPGQCPPEFNRG